MTLHLRDLPVPDTITLFTDRLKLDFPQDVPAEVAYILNLMVNLPVWQYQILVEEADKVFDQGPAPRIKEDWDTA